ncbi:uncharacterized protein LOC115878509 [Sitophilus oryzae]|uniref:Uncharacterized protein LOC115878509 n=1 Tax=Sitophilus oryzae TaxID=7048 RepID=A0A6J2XHI2_SITOR|nr:uncharacterized protein LOC115878509 [Sitophilus oryzae]
MVKREVAKSKNKMWETKCERVEIYMGGTRVSEAWKTIRNLGRDEKQNSKLELISIEKWEDHYKQLLTENRIEFKLEVPDLKNAKDIDVNEISVNEIKKALKNSKNGKAAGPGNIFIELIKQGPDILLEILADIFNRCLIKNENIPEDWNLAYISSIFKKGDKKRCSNYRGISLTSSMGRLYGRILKERVEESFEEIEEQGGFRAGRSCTDNIFVLQQIIEKRRARNLDTHLVFIDLEKAYDTVPLKKLFEILVEANEALKNWRRKSRAMGIEIDNHCLSTLFFADDQVIVAGCEEDADYMLRKLDEEYDRWGLNINLTKTEYLKVGEEQTEDPKLHIHEIKRCSEYKYLGSIISEEENSKKDIHSRVQQGKKVIGLLNPLLWSNKTSIQTKIRIYKAIVDPILTYGAECWQFTAKERRMVESVEMDFLRRACRILRMEHIRNEEIRQRTRRIYTSTDNIESRQLLWYGHVKRVGWER